MRYHSPPSASKKCLVGVEKGQIFPRKSEIRGSTLVLMYSNFDRMQIHWRRPVRLESNQGKGYEPRGPEAKKQSTH